MFNNIESKFKKSSLYHKNIMKAMNIQRLVSFRIKNPNTK